MFETVKAAVYVSTVLTACVVMGRAVSLLRAHYVASDAKVKEGRLRRLVRSTITFCKTCAQI